MKLLLDEHFSPEIARQLRAAGHDVEGAREHAELHGLGDGELLATATTQRRAVVTENVVDFVELHRSAMTSGDAHFGIIFTSARRFPRTRKSIGRLVRALDAVCLADPSDEALRAQTRWLERPE